MKIKVMTKEFSILVLSLSFALLTYQQLYAEDVEGSSDHPLLKRYKGSEIKKYDQREFDEYILLLGEVVHAPEEPNSVKITESEKRKFPMNFRMIALL
jgi:OmpA-OmpF porin, OOP family